MAAFVLAGLAIFLFLLFLLSFRSLLEWQVLINLAVKIRHTNVNNGISRFLPKAANQ